jgi:hypothetical protein
MAEESSIKVAVSRLIIDPAVQSRVAGLDPEHIASLEETPEAWPPLLAVRRGDQLVVVAGFHRHQAAVRLGLRSVQVQVLEAPADGDLRAMNFASNLLHGKPPSRTDKRAECERLLKLHPEWSDREVGRRCLLSQPTVAAVREALEESAQLGRSPVRVGRGGYTYTPRRPGELPDAGMSELLAGPTEALTGSKKARWRRLVGYLRRVSESLADQFRLPTWDPEAMADAARSLLGEDDAESLGAELGAGARNLLEVASRLGYDADGTTE